MMGDDFVNEGRSPLEISNNFLCCCSFCAAFAVSCCCFQSNLSGILLVLRSVVSCNKPFFVESPSDIEGADVDGGCVRRVTISDAA